MKKILYIILFVPLTIFAQVQNPCYSINNFITQQNIINPPISYQLSGGWNMVGYTGTAENSGIVNQINSALSNDSSIESTFQIIKNVSGQFWSSNFAQLLSFTQGEGYMMYVISETATSLSFNSPINIAEITGCKDCEAANFNQWANLDDGSCNYDSDGDGTIDSLEIVGCQDSLACNYNVLATDIGECSYAQDAYDCEGNITVEIGDEVFGGTLFYYDEIENVGLVASIDNIGEMPWGCSATSVDGADLTFIGSGYQNSIDIAAECNENPIAASASLNFESNGFSDWFLPSQFELDLMYSENILDNHQYWASTESNESASTAYIKTPNGGSNYWFKAASCFVHPIRAFGNWTMGCMDETACNYNTYANLADGSCTYEEQGYDCNGDVIAQIGDQIEGGLLFYLDDSNSRGLVVTSNDIGQFEWGCMDEVINETSATALGYGYANSLNIVSNCNEIPIAASVCLNLNYLGYSDWFLPSKFELEQIYEISGDENIGNFEDSWYWSSTQYDNNSTWVVDFNNGLVASNDKSAQGNVRGIRAFGNWTMGCMDESACNYNLEANMADGTCTYREQGYDCNGNLLPEIGSLMNGGIVFYIDETGEHGLVAAMEDLIGDETLVELYWGCIGTTISGADGQALGTGYQNTIDIVAGCIETNTAAYQSLNATTEGYTDWYLPSINELEEMYNTIGNGGLQGNIGGFSDSYFSHNTYWSSSEHNESFAYDINITDGTTNGHYKTVTRFVRVIRSF